MASDRSDSFCPWCTDGVAPNEDARSEICFSHFTQLLGELAERRWRRRQLGSRRLHHQFPNEDDDEPPFARPTRTDGGYWR